MLNADRNESIWLGTQQWLSKINGRALLVGGQQIQPMQRARDLCVILHGQLAMDLMQETLSEVVSTTFDCSVVCSDAIRALMTAFIASWLDPFNAVLLLSTLSTSQCIRMLQHV